MQIKIDKSWANMMKDFMTSDRYKSLMSFLEKEYQEETIFPKKDDIFRAFELTPTTELKVVILGQDPYHGYGQAHGLCFSVADGIKQPPSLRNIIKELIDDMDIPASKCGNLSNWAQQGVLMLNATLTVREKQAGSHQKQGWEDFTDELMHKISDYYEDIVFILWGNFAQKKAKLIDNNKHYIIKGVHPSPLSAHRGFFGSKPFSETNKFLISKNIEPINWEIPTDCDKPKNQMSLF